MIDWDSRLDDHVAEISGYRPAVSASKGNKMTIDDLPNYDAWKTHNPDDNRCEFCGAHDRAWRDGWPPTECDGECRRSWRDPDYEYERQRDDADSKI